MTIASFKRNLWNRIYRTTSYTRSALWIVPFASILLVLIVAPIVRWLDAAIDWNFTGLGVAGAQALFDTVITLSLSFMVFTFGSLLVAVQIAGGQLTPRIIATTLLRDNVVRYSVGLFVFSLIFAVAARDRLEGQVQQLVAFLGTGLGVTCIAAFLFLIDYAARLLRPGSILARVGNEGLAVIDAVYPQRVPADADQDEALPDVAGTARRIVQHAGGSSIVLAVDLETLMREGAAADSVIELVAQVGDFVAEGDALFVVYGGAAIDDAVLHAAVAFGPERTLEQDPLFAFRILVDIGLKALSPAINDPTTAVLAIDQIHRLLRVAGQRRLRGSLLPDAAGRARVIIRTPNWEDFVHVSCLEIRSCGAGNVQVARRLRAMLDNLATSLPEHRRGAIDRERNRLNLAVESLYAIPGDLALAMRADSQGLGGRDPEESGNGR